MAYSPLLQNLFDRLSLVQSFSHPQSQTPRSQPDSSARRHTENNWRNLSALIYSSNMAPKRKRTEVTSYEEHAAADESESMDSDTALATLFHSQDKRTRVASPVDYDALIDDIVSGSDFDPASVSVPKKKKSKRKGSLKSKKDAKKDAKPFPFFKLPAELRNQIYEYALIDPNYGTHIVSKKFSYRHNVLRGIPRPKPYNGPVCKLTTTLLRVSKQIHSEAAGLLYASPISFDSFTALHDFATYIGAGHRAMLKTLTIELGPRLMPSRKGKAFEAIAMLAQGGVNVEKLLLDGMLVPFNVAGQPKPLARQVYRDAHVWIDAIARIRGADKATETIDLGVENWYNSVDGKKLRDGTMAKTEEMKTKEAEIRADYRAELKRLIES
ncbi:hypothetical protein K402DRAFT_399261 [Aulographum hederae CBS 113979]|uniref:F-box domain-containing protein n=1 Tax=Aulographum hederae CBS 113979 TaxID=1176131 RepID=A0A6G1GIH2_9PEZI|nr:hypothetical protein K402DRAFT_399261 [Aulographum hederae CBS 113979]